MKQMNEMNDLETQLRMWAPRRPSARLKWRIFASQPTLAADSELPAFRLGWLAPVCAAFLVMCMLFNQRNNASFAGSASSAPLVALILSNQSAAAYLPGSFERQHNTLAGETFESTNGSNSASSISSLPILRGKSKQ